MQISYDVDKAPGWPAGDVPVTASSPTGQVYGTTGGRDEAIGLNLSGSPPPLMIRRVFPIADELRVHQNMRPNPDLAERQDDDVDALDVVPHPDACPYWLFSADREANQGMDPGDIFQVVPGGVSLVVDAQTHLCLLYTSDAADDPLCVDLCGRRIIKKKTLHTHYTPLHLPYYLTTHHYY